MYATGRPPSERSLATSQTSSLLSPRESGCTRCWYHLRWDVRLQTTLIAVTLVLILLVSAGLFFVLTSLLKQSKYTKPTSRETGVNVTERPGHGILYGGPPLIRLEKPPASISVTPADGPSHTTHISPSVAHPQPPTLLPTGDNNDDIVTEDPEWSYHEPAPPAGSPPRNPSSSSDFGDRLDKSTQGFSLDGLPTITLVYPSRVTIRPSPSLDLLQTTSTFPPRLQNTVSTELPADEGSSDESESTIVETTSDQFETDNIHPTTVSNSNNNRDTTGQLDSAETEEINYVDPEDAASESDAVTIGHGNTTTYGAKATDATENVTPARRRPTFPRRPLAPFAFEPTMSGKAESPDHIMDAETTTPITGTPKIGMEVVDTVYEDSTGKDDVTTHGIATVEEQNNFPDLADDTKDDKPSHHTENNGTIVSVSTDEPNHPDYEYESTDGGGGTTPWISERVDTADVESSERYGPADEKKSHIGAKRPQMETEVVGGADVEYVQYDDHDNVEPSVVGTMDKDHPPQGTHQPGEAVVQEMDMHSQHVTDYVDENDHGNEVNNAGEADHGSNSSSRQNFGSKTRGRIRLTTRRTKTASFRASSITTPERPPLTTFQHLTPPPRTKPPASISQPQGSDILPHASFSQPQGGSDIPPPTNLAERNQTAPSFEFNFAEELKRLAALGFHRPGYNNKSEEVIYGVAGVGNRTGGSNLLRDGNKTSAAGVPYAWNPNGISGTFLQIPDRKPDEQYPPPGTNVSPNSSLNPISDFTAQTPRKASTQSFQDTQRQSINTIPTSAIPPRAQDIGNPPTNPILISSPRPPPITVEFTPPPTKPILISPPQPSPITLNVTPPPKNSQPQQPLQQVSPPIRLRPGEAIGGVLPPNTGIAIADEEDSQLILVNNSFSVGVTHAGNDPGGVLTINLPGSNGGVPGISFSQWPPNRGIAGGPTAINISTAYPNRPGLPISPGTGGDIIYGKPAVGLRPGDNKVMMLNNQSFPIGNPGLAAHRVPTLHNSRPNTWINAMSSFSVSNEQKDQPKYPHQQPERGQQPLIPPSRQPPQNHPINGSYNNFRLPGPQLVPVPQQRPMTPWTNLKIADTLPGDLMGSIEDAATPGSRELYALAFPVNASLITRPGGHLQDPGVHRPNQAQIPPQRGQMHPPNQPPPGHRQELSGQNQQFAGQNKPFGGNIHPHDGHQQFINGQRPPPPFGGQMPPPGFKQPIGGPPFGKNVPPSGGQHPNQLRPPSNVPLPSFTQHPGEKQQLPQLFNGTLQIPPSLFPNGNMGGEPFKIPNLGSHQALLNTFNRLPPHLQQRLQMLMNQKLSRPAHAPLFLTQAHPGKSVPQEFNRTHAGEMHSFRNQSTLPNGNPNLPPGSLQDLRTILPQQGIHKPPNGGQDRLPIQLGDSINAISPPPTLFKDPEFPDRQKPHLNKELFLQKENLQKTNLPINNPGQVRAPPLGPPPEAGQRPPIIHGQDGRQPPKFPPTNNVPPFSTTVQQPPSAHLNSPRPLGPSTNDVKVLPSTTLSVKQPLPPPPGPNPPPRPPVPQKTHVGAGLHIGDIDPTPEFSPFGSPAKAQNPGQQKPIHNKNQLVNSATNKDSVQTPPFLPPDSRHPVTSAAHRSSSDNEMPPTVPGRPQQDGGKKPFAHPSTPLPLSWSHKLIAHHKDLMYRPTQLLAPFNGNTGGCVPRSYSFCDDVLTHRWTTLPNLAGARTEREKKQALPFFRFLLESECNPRMKAYLCYLLEPECNGGTPIPPCTNMCRLAQEGCERYIPKTHPLSAVFRCDLFSGAATNDSSFCRNLAADQGKGCLAEEFRCPDASCIPRGWLCDGARDCPLAADEVRCNGECTKAEFQCDAGARCIPTTWLCDRIQDCEDARDELGCPHKYDCSPDRFLCEDESNCIPRRYVCDGKVDCRDRSDETNCTNRACRKDDFKCANGMCIPKLWRCDGENDCKDNSDELNCGAQRRSEQGKGEAICPSSFLQCGTRCIRWAQICNGINDCEDGADEFNCKDGD